MLLAAIRYFVRGGGDPRHRPPVEADAGKDIAGRSRLAPGASAEWQRPASGACRQAHRGQRCRGPPIGIRRVPRQLLISKLLLLTSTYGTYSKCEQENTRKLHK